MHTVNNRTQLICCVYILYKAGELIITQPYFVPATSVTIYPLGTHVVRTSATEHFQISFLAKCLEASITLIFFQTIMNNF